VLQPNQFKSASLNQVKSWRRTVSPFDPCPPQLVDTFVVPPNLYLGFQPPNLPQFSPQEALRKGTLWPILFSPYEPGIG
jgi:spore coat protein JA